MKIRINPSDSLPLHAQVEHLLRRLMKSKLHRDGGKPLPREVELSEQLGVSRSTVRQAMQRLVSEGLLRRKRKVGTFVAPQRLTTRLSDWASFTAEMARQGLEMSSLRVAAELARPSPEVAAFFKIKRSQRCVKLTRLKGHTQREPVVLFVSLFHPRIGLDRSEDFTGPLYQMLQQRHGVIVAHSVEQINAVAADTALAKRFSATPANRS